MGNVSIDMRQGLKAFQRGPGRAVSAKLDRVRAPEVLQGLSLAIARMITIYLWSIHG